MNSQHNTLSAAMIKIEEHISEGFASFKLFKQDSQWYVIVNAVHTEAVCLK